MAAEAPRVSVRLGPDGVWYCRPYLGRTPDGRQVRPRRSFPGARTEAEALEEARAWVASVSAGSLDALLEDYIATREANGASPNSIRQYRTFARRYVARLLPGALAAEVTPRDLTRFETELLRSGGEGGSPLSPATVGACMYFLAGAYSYMVRQGLVASNPARAAERPSRERRDAVALDEADLSALIGWASASMPGPGCGAGPQEASLALAVWLALHTGMRVGEVCAVRRRDVSPLRGWVRVGGTVVCEAGAAPRRKEKPKSARSRRNVSMTARELGAIEAAQAWQDARIGGLGPSSPLVTPDGSWRRPDSVSRSFRRLARRLGIDPAATFHALRHTHATWLIARGVDIATVSERLGHAGTDTTARVYAHVLAGRDAAAAECFDALAEGMGG